MRMLRADSATKRFRRLSGTTLIGLEAPKRDVAAELDDRRDEEEHHQGREHDCERDRTPAPARQILRRVGRLLHSEAHARRDGKGASPIARSTMMSAKIRNR